MYCLVAAGAFGIEGMISDAGPGMTIVILCVLPFIWAAPQALCSARAWILHYRCRRILQVDTERAWRILGLCRRLVQNSIVLYR